METLRVDITYRPVRVGFVLLSQDRAAIRLAMKFGTVLWGGAYNPIIAVDQPSARSRVEGFRPDVLVPIGSDPSLAQFVAEYPHLDAPWYSNDLFEHRDGHADGRSRLLDLQNLLAYWHERPEWKREAERGIRLAAWSPEDPMADVFLAQYGGYPDVEHTGIAYADLVADLVLGIEVRIPEGGALPEELGEYPGRSYLARFGLEPDFRSDQADIKHGVYVGDPESSIDLINFWNLRAAGMSMLFVDLQNPGRTEQLHTNYLGKLRADLNARDTYQLKLVPAVWVREELAAAAGGLFENVVVCPIHSDGLLEVKPMRMMLGEETALGIVGGNPSAPRVRFALKDKKFDDGIWFFDQHVVATLSFSGVRGKGGDYTFTPPFIPELSDFVARTMWSMPSSMRLEPGQVAILTYVGDKDLDLAAIPIHALIEAIFGLAGFDAELSSGGLITRQFITRMGGLDGTRAFKIPGVRRLLKTHGPNASFTRKGAIQLIGAQDPETGASFSDHKGLYIEQRARGTELNPSAVFTHLVQKGLFRIGADLKCPACSLTSWTALDALRQETLCSLCGNQFDATAQLVEGQHAYRRSGVLGLERNTQGAVPVALLLQQLYVNLGRGRTDGLFAVSYDLKPKNPQSGLTKCETDFCVVLPGRRDNRPAVIVGECKDAGGTIDANDIDHLRKIVDAFPKNRMEAFVLLAKLAPFSAQEVELAKSLNTPGRSPRVIMLTNSELEPYHIFDRAKDKRTRSRSAASAADLAEATRSMYFFDKGDGAN